MKRYILVSSILALGLAGGCRNSGTAKTPSNQAQTGQEEGTVTKDVLGKEWVEPDVGAAEEEEEEDASEDADETIIEYGPSPDMQEDRDE
jgi:hypothetical protein